MSHKVLYTKLHIEEHLKLYTLNKQDKEVYMSAF